MADRTREAVVDMPSVLAEARIRDNFWQVVTFSAKRKRPVDTQIGAREEVGDELPRHDRLAEFIAAFQDVRPL